MLTHLALAVISAAILAYEVLLVRLFAITQWHNFAFMAISIALLGFGISGAVLALFQDWLRARFGAVFSGCATLFAVTSAVAFLLAQRLPFNALEVVWDPAQLFYLGLMYLLLAVPFTSGATCIGLAFVRYQREIGRIYLSNLLGSGAGAFGLLAALFVLSPTDSLGAVAALGLLAAGLMALGSRSDRLLAAVGGVAVFGVFTWSALPPAWLGLHVSEYKGLSRALRVQDARLLDEYSNPLALLSVVESPTIPFRHAPGLSLQAPALPPQQLGVYTDADSLTTINAFNGNLESLAHLDYSTDALGYRLTRQPKVLILGAATGRSVLQAIQGGAAQIDAVELNPDMIQLVRKDFANFAGRIYDRSDVTVHVAEARRFVTASSESWDLIQMPLLDSFGAGTAGSRGLSESYLFTVEAYETYYNHLRPGGWISITRWLDLPPRGTLKLLATARQALEKAKVADLADSFVMVRGMNTVTLLTKRGRVTGHDIAVIKSFAKGRSFDLGFYPDMPRDEANRANVLTAPYFFDGAQALLGPNHQAFVARYKFDIAPATDDRPYFFRFLKWPTLPELVRLRSLGGAAMLEWGEIVVVGTLLQALALSVLLILLPLRLGAFVQKPAGAIVRIGFYFCLIGLAFLFIEIAFIQKFILFLGHPLYAVSVMLTGFLVFAGFGAGISAAVAHRIESYGGGMGRVSGISAIDVAVFGIVGIGLIYLTTLPEIFEALSDQPDAIRILVSLALVAPLAFFMGMPFPIGLSYVSQENPALVPWAWGINGCASVVSAAAAVLLAMHFGFSVTVLIAAGCYVTAAFAFRARVPRSEGTPT